MESSSRMVILASNSLRPESGIAFNEGSILTDAAITRDVRNGIETLGEDHDHGSVEKKRVHSVDQYGEPSVSTALAGRRIQEQDKTEIHLQLVTKETEAQTGKLFRARDSECFAKLGAAEFAVEAVTLYGKLKRLTDYSDDDEGRYFWGNFARTAEGVANKISPDQYAKSAKAVYKASEFSGRCDVFQDEKSQNRRAGFSEEKPRDYVAAFNRFRRSYHDVFGNSNPEDLFNDIRG